MGFALIVLLAATPAAWGQVVQLPSMHNFSVSTSVLVPDRGSAYLGGVGRAHHSRTTSGWSPLGRNTSRAGSVAGTGVMVHATIIDHAELDALVLEEARAIRAAKGIEWRDPAEPRVAPSRDAPLASVAEIKRAVAHDDARREEAARTDFEKAFDYEQSGEHALARSYYRVAARKSSGSVRDEAIERLKGLPQGKK
jgi:hypothetical protein